MATLKLEDYIKQLQDPVPHFQDPEDLEDETAARLAPRAAEDDSDALQRSSSLRRRAATFMAVREGKVTSRKDLYGDSEDDESIDSESDVEEENEDSEEERFDNGGEDVEDEQEEVEMLDDDDDKEVEKDQESDDGEKSEDEEDEEAGDSDEEITSAESESAEEETIMQDTAVDEGEKAEAVVQQLDLWDRLMEARIQLQKVLSLVNRLPAPSHPPQTPSSPSGAKDVLLEINCTLCDAHSSPSSSRKRKAEADLEELAQQNHESLVQSRNSTLTFWDEKTRLASKKFRSFKSYQTPIVKQVEQILADRDRLLRRSQVIRDSDAPDVCEEPEEVFDDNDFYHRLLKNLIESKASEDSSMTTSASQWLEVQRLRGKKKKKKDVDTRASKGRKLRYNVHAKMVNFMAPRDDSTWSTEARNDLFKNLFKMPTYSEQ